MMGKQSSNPNQEPLVVQFESDPPTDSSFTIDDLGWTEAKAAEVRTYLASFVEDWDDARMDIYHDVLSLHKA